MKKSLCFALTFICVFMLSLSVVSVSVYASDNLTEILIPESLLSNFEEKEEIEALAEEVVDIANCFEEDGFYAEVSDVDFSKAYCVFIEANIFKEMPETAEELNKLLGSAERVWNIPVYANGKTVMVQVSRGLELSEIEQDNLSDKELERLKEKAGRWHTVSSTMYEDGEIPEQEIGEILSANRKNMAQCKSVLIGGESGIRTLIALVIENDTVSGAISLERAVSYTPDEQTQKSKASNVKTYNSVAGESENKVVLQQNQIYALDEFEKVVSQSPEESGSPLDLGMGGSSSGNGEQGIAVEYYIIGGVVLGIIILIGIFLHRRSINAK